jgi:hypothetical protein
MEKQAGIPETQQTCDPAAANKINKFLVVKMVTPLKE